MEQQLETSLRHCLVFYCAAFTVSANSPVGLADQSQDGLAGSVPTSSSGSQR